MGTLHEGQYTFSITSRSIFPEWKLLKTEVVEKIRTHILCLVSLILFFVQSSILGENGEKYDGVGQVEDDNLIWRTRCASRITL
jgi:hypothetical protein